MRSFTSELLKFTTTKLWWLLLIVVVVAGAIYAVTFGALQGLISGDMDAFTTPEAISAVHNGGNTMTRILALVLGVTSMGQEYRHHTITWTYLATPRRWQVLLAKVGATSIMGLLYGVVSAIVGVLVAIPMVMIFGGSMQLDEPLVWQNLALGVLSLMLWTLMGLGVGILIRNQVVAILVAIGFAYILEPLVSFVFAFQQWDVLLNLMPSGATAAMIGLSGNPMMSAAQDPFAWWLASLVLIAWAAVPTAIGMLVTIRRDVS
ncbi:ABC transporter permease subunit [Propionibacteriaceae bacterium Y2011]|uniref:ABC transporter permease subunit n=1 Tax=Microlunatus sp. Y2014 TaxID=3418488 RepID=UPI003B44D217